MVAPRMVVFIRFHARPGQAANLQTALEAILAPTRAEPGCVEIHLYKARTDRALFFIKSVWRDAAAFDVHANLPHMQVFLARLPDLIDHELEAVRTDRID